MFQRALTLGIAIATLVALPVRANEASRALLQRAVAQQDWEYAIGTVDRMIEEEGESVQLLEYRLQLELLRVRADLEQREAELARREAELAQRERQLQAQASPDLARLEYQAAIQERRDRLEAREDRRNQQRLQLAEEDFLRALTIESRARAGAFSRGSFSSFDRFGGRQFGRTRTIVP